MAHEKLYNLVKVGQLKAEDAAPEEIAGLIRSGIARLTDSRNDSLSIESTWLTMQHTRCHSQRCGVVGKMQVLESRL